MQPLCVIAQPNVLLRLGLRQIDGFPGVAAARLVAAREEGGVFRDLRELKDRTGLSPALRLAMKERNGSRPNSRK